MVTKKAEVVETVTFFNSSHPGMSMFRGKKRIKFINGKFTTADEELIKYLDGVTEVSLYKDEVEKQRAMMKEAERVALTKKVRVELREELAPEIRAQLEGQIEGQLRLEIETELRPQLAAELRITIIAELKAEAGQKKKGK